MANENASGGPLTATVGERLAEKGEHEAMGELERRVAGGARRGWAFRVPWRAVIAGAAAWALANEVARRLRRR